MVTGKTKTGFKFETDERVLEDWRLVLNIEKAESTDMKVRVKGVAELVHLLLGENEPKLLEHIAKRNDGFMPVDAIVEELADIIKETKELKNLPPSQE